jgi:hypothetical protein
MRELATMDELERYVIDGNISRFLDRLRAETDPARQQTLRSLLIAEENRFGTTLDCLQTVERHLMEGEDRIANQRRLIAAMRSNGSDPDTAERLLRTFESTQDLLQERHAAVHEEMERQRP